MQKPSFTEQIRQAIDDSGLSRYRICKLIGITAPSMSRFMSGKAFLAMPTLDKLAALLGMRLVWKKRPRKPVATGQTQQILSEARKALKKGR